MSFLRPSRLLLVNALLLIVACGIVGCRRLDAPRKEKQTKERLRALVVATAIYMSDYDNVLPPATTLTTLKPYLRPYLMKAHGSTEEERMAYELTFLAPLSGKKFVFNSSLAGTKARIVKQPDGKSKLVDPKVLFYEPTAQWDDKKRFVGMQDGVVESISESTWNSVTKKQNGIP